MPLFEPVAARGPAPSPSTMRLWLSDERRFWRLCTALFCCFAFIKGLRAPGDWPLTQAQIDYSHGFIKRALQGAVLSLLHVHHFHALSAVFFVQLIVLFLLLCQITRTALPEARFGSYAPIAIFASSFAVTFLAHIVGYTDIVLATITILLLLVRDGRTRFWCSVIVVPLALLIHENFLILFLPVLLFSFVLEACLEKSSERRSRYVFAGGLAVLAVAITLATSLHANLSDLEIDQFKAEIQTRVDFPLRDDFFDVLSRPLSGSVKEGIGGLAYADWSLRDLATLANLLPPFLLLLHFARRLLRGSGLHAGQQRTIWIAALIAILAPLTMYLLGVDGGRWNTACVLAAYLVLLMFCRTLPNGGFTLTVGERNAAILVLAINMASGMGLFNDAQINPFPFFPAMWERFR